MSFKISALIGSNYFRDAICIASIANEALSIVEEAEGKGATLWG